MTLESLEVAALLTEVTVVGLASTCLTWICHDAGVRAERQSVASAHDASSWIVFPYLVGIRFVSVVPRLGGQ